MGIVWAKADRGVWGLAHVFWGKLYLTRDFVDDHVVPKDFLAPTPAPNMRYKRGIGFYSEPM